MDGGGPAPGVNHLGIQVESDGDLGELRGRAANAEVAILDQRNASCCYAKSDKYWITDPQGVAWETYHTLDTIETFGEDTRTARTEGACCVPASDPARTREPAPQGKTCCG